MIAISGFTLSRVLGKRPELFTAYLHCSSQWDGDLNVLAEAEISGLLVLDIKERSYFTEKSLNSEHGGGNLFVADGEIMGWLLSKTKRTSLRNRVLQHPAKTRHR